MRAYVSHVCKIRIEWTLDAHLLLPPLLSVYHAVYVNESKRKSARTFERMNVKIHWNERGNKLTSDGTPENFFSNRKPVYCFTRLQKTNIYIHTCIHKHATNWSFFDLHLSYEWICSFERKKIRRTEIEQQEKIFNVSWYRRQSCLSTYSFLFYFFPLISFAFIVLSFW